MSKSGWVIKFKDGYKCAMSEEKYKQWKGNKIEIDGEVIIEEHWFDIKEGCTENYICSIMN